MAKRKNSKYLSSRAEVLASAKKLRQEGYSVETGSSIGTYYARVDGKFIERARIDIFGRIQRFKAEIASNFELEVFK